VRENRLRRMADRQGFRLEKSRRRDPRAIGYGTYRIVDLQTNAVMPVLIDGREVGLLSGLDLDGVEKWLTIDR